MRILHAVHGFPPEAIGGTELYVQRLARAQRDRGHEVSVFAGSLEWRPAVAVERSREDGVDVLRIHRADLYFDRWDKGFNPLVAAAFAEHVRAVRPAVVHVHQWIRLSSDLVRQAAAAGVPAVATAHDLYPSCPRVFRLKGVAGDEACEEPMGVAACLACVPRWRFQSDAEVAALIESYRDDMREELRLARVRIAPSRTHGEFLARVLGLDPGAFETIPHGLLQEVPPGARRATADGLLHLGYWSHLHPLKGAHVLLEAVGRMRERRRVRVHLFGAHADEAYAARLDQLGSGLDVVRYGRYQLQQVAAAELDLAVIPTLCRESWSFLLDEAFGLGLPIVASDAGALAERATARVRLFERNDPASLAAVLDELAADPQALARLRAGAAPEQRPFAEHAGAIEAAYARARALGPPALPAGDIEARLAEQWRRRETLLQELVRIEKWEDVVAELRQRIDDLEQEIRGGPPSA